MIGKPLRHGWSFEHLYLRVPEPVRPAARPEPTFVCPDCGEDAVGVMAVMEHLKRHSGVPEWHPALNGPSFVMCVQEAERTWARR